MDTKTLRRFANEKWPEITKLFVEQVDPAAASMEMDVAVYWHADVDADIEIMPMSHGSYYRPEEDGVPERMIVVFSARNWQHTLLHELTHHLQDLLQDPNLNYSASSFMDYYMQDAESQAEWIAWELAGE